MILQGMPAELNARMPASSSILVTNVANAFMNSRSAFDSSAPGVIVGTIENAFE